MNRKEYKTTRFDYVCGFYVEVYTFKGEVEFWLCHKDYGIKTLMFGMYEKDCPYDEWGQYIESNIQGYIPCYIEEIMN